MSRPHRPSPRTRSSLALRLGFVGIAVLPAVGCSVNARFQAGTTAEKNSRTREAQPNNRTEARPNNRSEARPNNRNEARPNNRNEARPNNRSNDDAAARERARKRRVQDDIDRIDREAKERVAQAEREAADRERAAEAEAERDRQRAAADADEQRKREAEQAARAKQPKQRRQTTGRFDMGTQGATGGNEADHVLQRRNTEINQSTDEKKAAIRKQLEQNKSDILVAAERKRTEVQESLKDKPEKQP